MPRKTEFELVCETESTFWSLVEGVAKAHGFSEISGVEFLVSTKFSGGLVARARMSRHQQNADVVEHRYESADEVTGEPLVAAMQFFATVCKQFPDALDAAKENMEKRR